MTNEHDTTFTAAEVIADLKSKGAIPSGPPPAPARKHRTAELLAYALSGACLGLAVFIAGLMTVRLIVTLIY